MAATKLSKWIVRIVVVLLLWPVIGILWFGKEGWEIRLPDLSGRETSIARTGILLEHATQLFLWILVLAVNEMANDNHLRMVAILTTIAWLAYAGIWGLKTFFVGCQSYGLCLKDCRQFQIISALFIGIMMVALVSSSKNGYEPIINQNSRSNHNDDDDDNPCSTKRQHPSVDVEQITSSETLLLHEALEKAKTESKDKDKLIAKLGKKLKSLLAENEVLRTK